MQDVYIVIRNINILSTVQKKAVAVSYIGVSLVGVHEKVLSSLHNHAFAHTYIK